MNVKMWPCANMRSDSNNQNNNSNDEEEYCPVLKKQKVNSNNNWDDNLTEALNACKSHDMGIEEAAAVYQVSQKTIRSQLKEKSLSVIDIRYEVFVLNPIPVHVEEDLVTMVQNLITGQFVLNDVDVRRLGYEVISEKYQLDDCTKRRDCLLGNKWYNEFMSKYPHLQTEQHVNGHSKHRSLKFYQALEMFLKKFKIVPSRIFSVDAVDLKFRAASSEEVNLFHKRKVIYTNAQALCCTNPCGLFIPPIFIKPLEDDQMADSVSTDAVEMGDRSNTHQFLGHTVGVDGNAFTSHLQDQELVKTYSKLREMHNSPTNMLPSAEEITSIQKQIRNHLSRKLQSVSKDEEEELREKLLEQFNLLKNKIKERYDRSVNLLSEDIFYEWLQCFVSHVKPNPDVKTLLLLSDHGYAKHLRCLELAKLYGIIFLALPPHSVHKIHPLDGFTMAVNRNLSTCASVWLGKNPECPIQQVPLNFLFKTAYANSTSINIAKNGFLYSGIWPVNRSVVESTELGGRSILKQSPPTGDVGLYSSTSFVLADPLSASSSITTLGLPEINKHFDMRKLCRVCMKEKVYTKSLFEASSLSSVNFYGKRLSELASVQIAPGDGLPDTICQLCEVHLNDAVRVRNTAVQSHIRLLKLKETLDQMYFEGSGNGKLNLSSYQLDSGRRKVHGSAGDAILTKDFNINSMCRICTEQKPLMTGLFYKGQGDVKCCVDIARRIAEVCQCQVHIHDGLSSSICPSCRACIIQASELIERVVSSEQRCREILCQLQSL